MEIDYENHNLSVCDEYTLVKLCSTDKCLTIADNVCLKTISIEKFVLVVRTYSPYTIL